MLADGTYLVPDDFTNFRDDPRDVRQVPEPPYCADLATGAPLFDISHSTGRLHRSLVESTNRSEVVADGSYYV